MKISNTFNLYQSGSLCAPAVIVSCRIAFHHRHDRQSLLALMVKQFKDWLQRPGVGQIFDGITGTVMVALGLRIAVDA
jgi:threonine/homoserine/homoserine lactone efflux protein